MIRKPWGAGKRAGPEAELSMYSPAFGPLLWVLPEADKLAQR